MNENYQQKFLESYDHHADAIFRHCFFRVYDREIAKDLVQEVFCRVWTSMSQGKEIENVLAFLYRIANNLVIDYSRKRRAVSLDAMIEEGFSLRDDSHLKLGSIIDAKQVYCFLHSLDSIYQPIVVMRFIDGMSPKEISEVMDLSENVVSVRLNRGIKKLRKIAEQTSN